MKNHKFVPSAFNMVFLVSVFVAAWSLYLYVVISSIILQEKLMLWIWILITVILIGIPIFLVITLRTWLSVVTLSEQGITQFVFGFIKGKEIGWEELREIRIVLYGGTWVCFSKTPLDDGSCPCSKVMERKDAIFIGYSETLIKCIRSFTDKEILSPANARQSKM